MECSKIVIEVKNVFLAACRYIDTILCFDIGGSTLKICRLEKLENSSIGREYFVSICLI